MLWRARGETTSGKNNSGENGQGNDTNRGVVEIRLDVSSDRMDLLHRAQHFLQEALMAPEKLNDPALRAQVGEVKHRSFEQLHVQLRMLCLWERSHTHRAEFHPLLQAGLAPTRHNSRPLCSISPPPPTAFCKEARGDCKEALALYASIISDSALSPGTSNVIFRTSVLLAYVGRFDEVGREKYVQVQRSVAQEGDKNCTKRG